IIDRFRSLPMARSAVLVGRTVADLARNAASMTVIVVVGLAMGFHLHASVAAGLVAVLLALFFGYATSWVFAAVGLAVKAPPSRVMNPLHVIASPLCAPSRGPATTWRQDFLSEC